MLVTVRCVSGTHDVYDMTRNELDTFSKWLLDDNSNNIYTCESLHYDNSENVYIFEKQNHTFYIFKEKIEYVHFPTT